MRSALPACRRYPGPHLNRVPHVLRCHCCGHCMISIRNGSWRTIVSICRLMHSSPVKNCTCTSAHMGRCPMPSRCYAFFLFFESLDFPRQHARHYSCWLTRSVTCCPGGAWAVTTVYYVAISSYTIKVHVQLMPLYASYTLISHDEI